MQQKQDKKDDGGFWPSSDALKGVWENIKKNVANFKELQKKNEPAIPPEQPPAAKKPVRKPPPRKK